MSATASILLARPGSRAPPPARRIFPRTTSSAQEMLSDIPPNLAEDVVRGKIRLAGGGALLPGLASKIEAVADIPAFVVDDPLRCVIRGAAEVLEHGYEAK